ncbi:hypothetical protein MMAD_18120 [Mycolicibacterium madagascariense]|uniref:Uncharacterized protein n=2 Tax=Mycolicibacterium madagascariense TaxID=212765 RepID=A0A7I7XEC6_9MYCO|nr:hypothetical protein MMAD_18120 [Mycolicibacterium madagascariense]
MAHFPRLKPSRRWLDTELLADSSSTADVRPADKPDAVESSGTSSGHKTGLRAVPQTDEELPLEAAHPTGGQVLLDQQDAETEIEDIPLPGYTPGKSEQGEAGGEGSEDAEGRE